MQSSRPRLKACRPKLIIRNTALLYNLGKVLFKVRDTSFLQTTIKNVAILPHARAPMVAVSQESHYEISVPHPWHEMSSKHLTQLT